MKKGKSILVALFVMSISFLNAQVAQVDLEQTKGKFTTESLTLAEGDYQFNISNNGVANEVGFVLVPKGKYDASNHIKEAYVQKTVATGMTSATNIVKLAPGEYEYFCPMNKTPKYSITVLDNVDQIKLSQVEGSFRVQALTVSEGSYQFEISNDGVDREVGFVLVPKGKYDASNHIKTAYVKAPVTDGNSSMTGIVKLAAGEYEYFCPLNPTPKYSLTVTN